MAAGHQEQLHIQALDALTHLVMAAEAAAAIMMRKRCAMPRRLLTLEPWLEEAHCQVMHLLARRGEARRGTGAISALPPGAG